MIRRTDPMNSCCSRSITAAVRTCILTRSCLIRSRTSLPNDSTSPRSRRRDWLGAAGMFYREEENPTNWLLKRANCTVDGIFLVL